MTIKNLIFFVPTASFFRLDTLHRTSKMELLAQKISAFLIVIYSVLILVAKMEKMEKANTAKNYFESRI